MAIVAAANPIAVLRSMMLNSFVVSTPAFANQTHGLRLVAFRIYPYCGNLHAFPSLGAAFCDGWTVMVNSVSFIVTV